MLEARNFYSDAALSGQEALKHIKARKEKNEAMYRLIFLDYSMPDMDGPEVAK